MHLSATRQRAASFWAAPLALLDSDMWGLRCPRALAGVTLLLACRCRAVPGRPEDARPRTTLSYARSPVWSRGQRRWESGCDTLGCVGCVVITEAHRVVGWGPRSQPWFQLTLTVSTPQVCRRGLLLSWCLSFPTWRDGLRAHLPPAHRPPWRAFRQNARHRS